MKRVVSWLLRIACFAVVGAAVYTLVGCLMHINDDYSAGAILGNSNVQTFQSGDGTAEGATNPQTTALPQPDVDEAPTVVVYADGTATAGRPYVTVTAAFSDIVNSIVADLNWYMDGELVGHEQQRLLVEGSTVSCKVEVELEQAKDPTAEVSLEVLFNDKTVTGKTDIQLAIPESEEEGQSGIVIQTTEIPVTAKRETEIYTDSDFTVQTGKMKKNETGLLLDYKAGNNGLSAIMLQFEDRSSGWVDAGDLEITDENCTTDEDYEDTVKERFVNNMQYDSQTDVMVWVSLYTQKVNVFSGYQGNWKLLKVFDCSTGVNTSPTTTGAHHYINPVERWDMGSTYVEPVLVFNGGEAFTSQPYDTNTGKIADDTIGEPASGGCVRMLEKDILWMQQNLPLASLIVVY